MAKQGFDPRVVCYSLGARPLPGKQGGQKPPVALPSPAQTGSNYMGLVGHGRTWIRAAGPETSLWSSVSCSVRQSSFWRFLGGTVGLWVYPEPGPKIEEGRGFWGMDHQESLGRACILRWHWHIQHSPRRAPGPEQATHGFDCLGNLLGGPGVGEQRWNS